MTIELYVASFGHRYSDPCATAVGLTREAVEDAIEYAMEEERADLVNYCDIQHANDPDSPVEDCSLCTPDLVTFGVWPIYRVDELGGLRNTIEILRECRESDIGVTFPDCMRI